MDPIFHQVDGAPDQVAPFSHAAAIDGWVFLTGQMPFAGKSVVSGYPDGIEARTHQVINNLVTVLPGCGLTLRRVVSVRIYLVHFDEDYELMNRVYATYFPMEQRPARTCIGISALAKGARIEIDMVARR